MFYLTPPTGHKIYIKDFFKSYIDFPFQGYLFNSGTSALYFLINNLKIPQKSKILLPAYSCPTVAAAVLGAGHYPVLCDIYQDTLNYDLSMLKRKITKENIKATIWVNLFGIGSDIPEIGIPVILDNAQVLPNHFEKNQIVLDIFTALVVGNQSIHLVEDLLL